MDTLTQSHSPGAAPLSTDGIDINTWHITMPWGSSAPQVELSAWDFAGNTPPTVHSLHSSSIRFGVAAADHALGCSCGQARRSTMPRTGSSSPSTRCIWPYSTSSLPTSHTSTTGMSAASLCAVVCVCRACRACRVCRVSNDDSRTIKQAAVYTFGRRGLAGAHHRHTRRGRTMYRRIPEPDAHPVGNPHLLLL
jgi:hypothetical protein